MADPMTPEHLAEVRGAVQDLSYAPADVRALLAEVERLRTELARVGKERSEYQVGATVLQQQNTALADVRDRLAERLTAAEAVAVVFGWAPINPASVRWRAAFVLWERWAAKAPGIMHAAISLPEWSDEAIADLARQYDEDRARALGGGEGP